MKPSSSPDQPVRPVFGKGRIRAQALPIVLLIRQISGDVARPILDYTGLDGPFDVSLQWQPTNARVSVVPTELPDIETALRQQLGLRLVPHKAPTELLVIDAVNRRPTEN